MKLFQCQTCSQVLFFHNMRCESCGSRLGYLPESAELSVVNDQGDAWEPSVTPGVQRRFCSNAGYDACNWLLAPDTAEDYCLACRHNRVVPDLSEPDNLQAWLKMERAKRHLFYSLLRLHLPLANRIDDPQYGLAFDFLKDPPGGNPAERVMTGHDDGVITLNIKEADDAVREKARLAFHEPYRTLLGHFRHEIGHYFWDRLLKDQPGLQQYRAIFGDETADYGDALRSYYANGPAPNWQQDFVSAYASAHSWEDFAETWAHYLHIVDTLEMARDYGIQVHPVVESTGLPDTEIGFDPHGPVSIDQLVGAWLPLTLAVNSINRCMGQPDLYPFILSPAVIGKLGFIHDLVHGRLDTGVTQEMAPIAAG
jgi:hypothetical protein